MVSKQMLPEFRENLGFAPRYTRDRTREFVLQMRQNSENADVPRLVAFASSRKPLVTAHFFFAAAGHVFPRLYFYATELLPISGCPNVHVRTAFTWEKAICTVSSAGRASDS